VDIQKRIPWGIFFDDWAQAQKKNNYLNQNNFEMFFTDF
jgi:hypothetical protein